MEAISLPVTTVVESRGNPIQVSCVVVYRIVDAARALLDVRNYHPFVAQQASTVLKTVCAHYPYEGRTADEPPACHAGGLRNIALLVRSGGYGAISGASTAVDRMKITNASPATAPLLALK